MKIKRISAVFVALALAISGNLGVFAEDTAADASAGTSNAASREANAVDYTPYMPEYTGEGRVIAVLDSGFDITHECFAACPDGRLTAEHVGSLEGLNATLPTLTAEEPSEAESTERAGFYVSEKIPFAYNYADMNTSVEGISARGTAVMSAIAGNGSRFKGEAPGAQLLAMKVTSDVTGEATEAAIVAAIGDAILLGADVICLDVGEPCGFDDRTADGFTLEDVLAKAEAAGILVVSPTGDTFDIGEQSLYYTEAGITAPPTSLVDRSTVAYPASSPSVLSSAGADGNFFVCDSLLLGAAKLPYSDTSSMYTATDGKSFAEFFDGRVLEYEYISGVGKPEDYPVGLELDGKLALVERGELTFAEKCRYAAERGAIGVIIIDNQVDDNAALSTKMDLTDAPIPAIILSITSGNLLKKATDRRVTVTVGEKLALYTSPTPTPTETSAGGATPELGLKPELSIVSDGIECASAGGGYSTYSGSAIATARLAGMLACIKERLIDDAANSSEAVTATELAEQVKALAMSSAELMYKKDGKTPYSPREQGSGTASLESALEAELLVTSNGKAKLELGELSGRYFELALEVENLTPDAIDCTLDVIVGSDSYLTFTYEELETDSGNARDSRTLAEMLGKLPTDSVSFAGDFKPFEGAAVYAFDGETDLNAFSDASNSVGSSGFTLDGYERVSFRLSVLLDEATYNEYRKVFENGFFVEGFVRVESEHECASLPFMGFMGDFSKQGALDFDVYTEYMPLYDDTGLFYIHRGDLYSGELILGANPFDYLASDSTLSRELICFSPTSGRGVSTIKLRLALLRNIEEVGLKLTDESGRVILERAIGSLAKTYADHATNMLVSPIIEIWNGRAPDNTDYVYHDGLYEIELSYRIPGDDIVRYLKYPLRIDTCPPEITVERIESDGKNALLFATVTDDVAVASVSVVDKHRVEAYEVEPGCFNIRGLSGRYIYIEVIDYALNSSIVRIENPNYSGE